VCAVGEGCEALNATCHSDVPRACVDGWLSVASLNVWMFCPALMLLTVCVGMLSSRAFAPPTEAQLDGLCFQRFSERTANHDTACVNASEPLLRPDPEDGEVDRG
jgi:hypothetical protein